MKDSIPLAPLQKFAWFNLAVFALAVVLYLIAVPFFAWHFHRAMAATALPSLGVFGVCGLWGFADYFLHDRKRRTKVKLDEWEELISQRVARIGIVLFWQVFVFSCMGVWAYLSYIRHQATVPIGFLPFLVAFGGVVFYVTQSLAILVQDRRSAADDTL